MAQTAAQPQTSFASLPALTLNCALVIAQTMSGATRQVPGLAELAYDQPDLASNPQAVTQSTPGIAHRLRELTLKRAQALCDLLLDAPHHRPSRHDGENEQENGPKTGTGNGI